MELLKKLLPIYQGKEIVGYKKGNTQVIKKIFSGQNEEGAKVKKFRFLKNQEADLLLQKMREITQSSFKNQILNELGENEKDNEVKKIAKKYMENLRREEKSKIDNNSRANNTTTLVSELNDANEEVEDIKNNRAITINKEKLQNSIRKSYNFLKENKGGVAVVATAGATGIISILFGELNIKKA